VIVVPAARQASLGHFQVLRNFPADREFDVIVDTLINDDWLFFDRQGFIDLVESSGRFLAEALSQFSLIKQ
jgi:hypothetical protein